MPDSHLGTLGEQTKRMAISKHLKKMYMAYGFGNKLVPVGGTYNQRLTGTIELADTLLPRIEP